MGKFFRQFVTEDMVTYRFQVGRQFASGLDGLIAGALVTSIIFGTVIYFLKVR